MRRWFARALRMLANGLDPIVVLPIVADVNGDAELRFAEHASADLIVRDALHRALHRFSPAARPAQA
jgi:hypothetical protein